MRKNLNSNSYVEFIALLIGVTKYHKPLARSLASCALVFRVICGPTPLRRTARGGSCDRAHAQPPASERDSEKKTNNRTKNEIFKYWCLMCQSGQAMCRACSHVYRHFGVYVCCVSVVRSLLQLIRRLRVCIGNILPVDAQISGNLFFRTTYRHYSVGYP